MMDKVCNSLNQISLAIQTLPLLHLAGYSSPRDELVIGHSAVALPVLLSEVYSAMCSLLPIPPSSPLKPGMRWKREKEVQQQQENSAEKSGEEKRGIVGEV